MSGHGVVSKHSPADAADDVGPIQKWKRNKREGEGETETMVTSDISS